MALVKDTVSILEEIISGLSLDVVISSVVDNSDGTFTCLSKDTQHLSVGRIVDIDGSLYKVTSFIQDESFTVKKRIQSSPDPVAMSITIPPPFFINGTIISAKRELDKVKWTDKYPMIFLYEIYRERWKSSDTDPIAFDSKVRLFFMDQTSQQDYTTSEQYEEKIRPMRSLSFSFLELLESNQCITGDLTKDWDLIPWVNFGKFKTDTGNIKAFFNDEVSGYELVIDLPIKKSYIDA